MSVPNKTNKALHAVMMVNTTGGLVEAGCQNSLSSTDPKAIADFFKGACTTAGFTTQFALDPATKRIAHIFKKGKLIQRDIKPLLEKGYTEWSYSWAWSPKQFKFTDGSICPISEEIDLVKAKELLPWAKAFGYA